MYLDNFKSDHITWRYCYRRRCFGIVKLLSILIFKIATLFFLHTHILHVKTFEIYQKLLTNNITPRDLHSISFLFLLRIKMWFVLTALCHFLSITGSQHGISVTNLTQRFFYKKLIIFIYYKVKMLIFYDKTLIWYCPKYV